MNLLEHYIKKVISAEVLPEEYVDMTGMPGFEGRENYLLKERLKVKYLINCYGNKSEIEKIYFSHEDYQNDLDRGYFFA